MRRFILLMLGALIPSLGVAAEPYCSEHSSGPYCSYVGKVKKLYINDQGLILMYFDTSLNVSKARSLGMNISKSTAAAYRMSDNPEFAKMLYSTLLTAQSSGRQVEMQMREKSSSYLIIDRIWIAE